MRLILASASPRRAELLTAAGYAFDIHAVDVDRAHRTRRAPASYVQRLAAEKSARALAELTSSPARETRLCQIRYIKGDGPTEAGTRRDADVRQIRTQCARLMSGSTRTACEGVPDSLCSPPTRPSWSATKSSASRATSKTPRECSGGCRDGRIRC